MHTQTAISIDHRLRSRECQNGLLNIYRAEPSEWARDVREWERERWRKKWCILMRDGWARMDIFYGEWKTYYSTSCTPVISATKCVYWHDISYILPTDQSSQLYIYFTHFLPHQKERETRSLNEILVTCCKRRKKKRKKIHLALHNCVMTGKRYVWHAIKQNNAKVWFSFFYSFLIN